MLALPTLLAVLVAWPLRTAAWVAIPSFLLFFLAQDALVNAARCVLARKRGPDSPRGRRLWLWTAIHGCGGATCLGAALVTTEAAIAPVLLALSLTAALGLAYVAMAVLGIERLLGARLTGIAAFASTAPLLMTLDGKPSGHEALGVGALVLGYFISTLLHVRSFRSRCRSNSRRGVVTHGCLLSHVAAGAIVSLLWLRGALPAGALAVLVPVSARVGWEILRPPSSLKVLGLREIGVAAAFLSAAAALLP